MSFRERRELLALLHDDAGHAADSGVLISLVRVTGSSYRRAGARMLILPDGRAAGTLSGGCLEADLLRRASWSVRDGAVLEHVSTSFDDASDMPFGLGCGGEVDLLLEPLSTPEAGALIDAIGATVRGEFRQTATLLPNGTSRATQRIVMDAGGDVLFASASLSTDLIVALRAEVRAAHVDVCDVITTKSGEIAIENLMPVQRLVIFGAGEDARPLARLGLEMGWTVVVADTRAQRATALRFPGVHQISVAESAAALSIQAEDAVVLMTHSYEQDRKLLAEMLAAPPRYLGLLGARQRSALLLQQASEIAGVPLSAAVSCTHSPVGLSIGGDGPEAVALAIVAEVQHSLSFAAQPSLSRRLTLSQTEQLLLETPAANYAEAVCALYADPAPGAAR